MKTKARCKGCLYPPSKPHAATCSRPTGQPRKEVRKGGEKNVRGAS